MRTNKTISALFLLYSTLATNGFGQIWNVPGSGSWDVATNWSTPALVPNLATDNVIINNSVVPGAPITLSIPGTFAIEDLSFTSPGFNCTLSGGTLNSTPLVGAGIAVTGSDQHTINTNLNYLAAYTITQGSTLPLTISGSISGSLAVSKAGTGDLILSGSTSNIFSGLLTISAGKVVFNKSAGILACGNGVTLSGATSRVQFDSSEQTSPTAAFTISNATAVLDLNGQSSTIGTLSITTTGTYNLGGTLNLAGTTATTLQSPTAASSPTITGTVNLIGTTGTVAKTATGTLTLQNVGIQNGTHDFNSATALTTIITINGIISGNGNFNKIGPGDLNLTGSSDNSYTGLTTVTAGPMYLNRPNRLCIPGDVLIAGGALTLQQDNQIANSSNMTITSGSFAMGAFGERINSLTLNGGSVTGNTGSGLVLQSTSTALSMRITAATTIPGTIYLTGAIGGDVVLDPSSTIAPILTNIDLGSTDRIFNIGNGSATPDITINGVVSSTGGLNKTGSGTMSFASTSSNTFTGLTTVSAGTLLLSKTAPFISIAGDILIDGGIVQNTIANQIADTSNVQLNSGTFDINNLGETIKSFTYNGGTFSQGTGQLSLSSSTTALTMRNTIIPGTINLTGLSGGNIVFDATNNGTALINFINLGTSDRLFEIDPGENNSVKMVMMGSSGTSGALIKSGLGILELKGNHTYTLSNTQVLNGTLLVNGNLTCPAVTVSPGATIQGSGLITSAMTFNGILKPGNSIGTINLVGAQTFGSSFILENEFNQTATDLVNITGSLTINPGATVTLASLANSFSTPLTHTIIQTTTGITGTFTTLNNPLIFYNASLIYNPNSVLLQLTPGSYSRFDFTGNAGAVANYLDGLNIQPGSDLDTVDRAIRELTTKEAVKEALLQLQPSHLKGLALSSENNAFQIESIILQRAHKTCCSLPVCRTTLWGALNGDVYDQHCSKNHAGFESRSADLVVGVDAPLNKQVIIGAASSYTYSSTNWERSRGDGEIQSGSLATYLNWNKKEFFTTGLILGSYNSYKEKRNIRFSTIDREAKGDIQGCQFLANLLCGTNFHAHSILITPYFSGQFLYMHFGSFHEKGANSINLDLFSTRYSLFRGQGGWLFSHCDNFDYHKINTTVGLSYIREQRFSGKRFTSSFEGQNSTFTVIGKHPSRNVFYPEISLSFLSKDERLSATIGYNAQIGNGYLDQALLLQGRYAF